MHGKTNLTFGQQLALLEDVKKHIFIQYFGKLRWTFLQEDDVGNVFL